MAKMDEAIEEEQVVTTVLYAYPDWPKTEMGNHLETLSDYTRIPYHIVFDVKFDGRRKARLVCNESKTTPPKEDIYSGVVGIENVRLTFLIAEMNNLDICAAHIGNTFLCGKVRRRFKSLLAKSLEMPKASL